MLLLSWMDLATKASFVHAAKDLIDNVMAAVTESDSCPVDLLCKPSCGESLYFSSCIVLFIPLCLTVLLLPKPCCRFGLRHYCVCLFDNQITFCGLASLLRSQVPV